MILQSPLLYTPPGQSSLVLAPHPSLLTPHSSHLPPYRWLVEDYAAFAMLQRRAEPSACLGVVDACYTVALSLENYCSDK